MICNHCGEVIVDTPSESGPSVIRDGNYVYCNIFCYTGKTKKAKPSINTLARVVSFLGGTKVNRVLKNTINKVNKR